MSKMSDFPSIPERISKPLNTPELLDLQRDQAEAAEFSLFQGPLSLSSIPSYLAVKISALEKRVEYLKAIQRALSELQKKGSISALERRDADDDIESVKLSFSGEILAVKLHKSTIIEDMTDWIRSSSEPDAKEAYAAAMMGTVVLRTGKQAKTRFTDFKSQALEFYGAIRTSETGDKKKFCHLLGIWKVAMDVRIAHIVPQSLDKDTLVHLFGRDVKPGQDCRNALSLTRRLEVGLDCGEIVIVPILGEIDAWKCVVTRSGLDGPVSDSHKWKDIDGKKLTFLNEARPRRRYLFFRYLITYLWHKKHENLKWAENIHNEYQAWCSPGKYLQQSSLRILLQKATGEDLPETMFQMFDTTTDSAAENLPLSATNLREEAVSQLVATAVLNTRLTDADLESSDESDEE